MFIIVKVRPALTSIYPFPPGIERSDFNFAKDSRCEEINRRSLEATRPFFRNIFAEKYGHTRKIPGGNWQINIDAVRTNSAALMILRVSLTLPPRDSWIM